MFEQAVVSIRYNKRFLPNSHLFVLTQCAATFCPEQKNILHLLILNLISYWKPSKPISQIGLNSVFAGVRAVKKWN